MPNKTSANSGEKVIVAMSGGVDSSIAAYLLHKEGYRVIGVSMSFGIHASNDEITPGRCCSIEDAADAQKVAIQAGFPFYTLNFRSGYEQLVEYFCDEYSRGRTPNPCIKCNEWLKFGRLWEYGKSIDCKYIATGHYSRIEHRNGRWVLKRAVDSTKDQSYVLFALSQEVLSRTLFPLGEMQKKRVRALARDINLAVKNKAESQDICFVPEGDYRRLLKERIPRQIQSGFIRDTSGKILGRHEGIQFYTIGQRRGLGIATGKPMYVVAINAPDNEVIVGESSELYRDEISVSGLNWVSIPPPNIGRKIQAHIKIRYTHTPVKGTVHVEAPSKVRVVFSTPQRAVTPGQAAVFYDGDDVLGGGWID